MRSSVSAGVARVPQHVADGLFAALGGAVDAETGMVVDLVALDDKVRVQVLERFDHGNLNLDPLFTDRVPTTENFCKAIFELLHDTLPAGELVHVRVEETENNFFECSARG